MLILQQAGTGTSGVVVPFVMHWGLGEYGFRTMLRAWAVAAVVLTAPLLYYVRPRLPVSATTRVRRFDLSFLRNSSFWILQAGNILEGLGLFIPSIYLPSYARALGLFSTSGTLMVALLNTTSVFGGIILGALVDKLHVTTVVLISTLGVTLSVFLLWGFAASLPLLCIFSLMYGLNYSKYSDPYYNV